MVMSDVNNDGIINKLLIEGRSLFLYYCLVFDPDTKMTI